MRVTPSRAFNGVTLALLIGMQAPAALAQDSVAAAGTRPGTAVLTGLVTDSEGLPLPYAAIHVTSAPDWAVSDTAGRFRLEGIAVGWQEVFVGVSGYDPLTVEMGFEAPVTVEVRVRLTAHGRDAPLAVELEPIVLMAEGRPRYVALVRNGFYERERRGWGTFLGPEDLQRTHAGSISDLIRTVPGVEVERRWGGSVFDVIWVGRDYGRRCVMRVLLNGMSTSPEWFSGIHPDDVLAVEVYPRGYSVPPNLVGHQITCGVVAIWTQ